MRDAPDFVALLKTMNRHGFGSSEPELYSQLEALLAATLMLSIGLFHSPLLLIRWAPSCLLLVLLNLFLLHPRVRVLSRFSTPLTAISAGEFYSNVALVFEPIDSNAMPISMASIFSAGAVCR